MSSRRDILGLRGLALLFVISPFIGFKQVTGWFIGFDVLFIIVGYLITKHLFNSYRKNAKYNQRQGFLDLKRFYVQAIGIILPSAFIVIGLSYLLASLLTASTSGLSLTEESIWATFMTSNIYAMSHSFYYFAPRIGLSPFDFFWAVSLLAQCTVIFSLIVVGAVSINTSYLGAKKVQSRQRLRIVLSIIIFLSAFYMLLESRVHPNTTLFSSGARLWEFALGGLCATVKFRSKSSRNPFIDLNRTIALVVICASPFVLKANNFYLLIPFTLLAVAYLLWAVPREDGTWATRILSSRPLTHLGIIAYPFLLWLAPALYVVRVLGIANNALAKGILFFVVVMLAIATHAIFIKDLSMRLAKLIDGRNQAPSNSATKSVRFGILATALCLGLSVISTPVIFSNELAPGERPVAATISPTPTPTRPANVVFLGASITSGYGVSPLRSWTSLVSNKLGWNETNLARYGTGFTHGYSKGLCRKSGCKSIAAMARVAISLKPDAVVISGGRNDCNQARNNPSATKEAIRQTFTTLRTELPTAQITSMAVVLNDKRPTPQCYLDINSWIAQASNSNSINYITDVSYWLTGKTNLMKYDGIHPTTSGHAEIARRFVEWFRAKKIQINII